MPTGRRALLLGCGTFADPSLAPLRSPRLDVERLGEVLRNSDVGDYATTSKVDCSSGQAHRAVEGFFVAARVSDSINVLYLSCHGVQDSEGKLYFAFNDTELDYLSSTAMSADWVRDRIYASRSRATLILVDCCFSGAFITGMQARSSAAARVESLLSSPPSDFRAQSDGRGIAILTASGETEISFEDSESRTAHPSYFTEALISGLSSGSADLDGDGRVTVDELYDYVYDRVVRSPSPQRPRRLGIGEGSLVVADTPAMRTSGNAPATAPHNRNVAAASWPGAAETGTVTASPADPRVPWATSPLNVGREQRKRRVKRLAYSSWILLVLPSMGFFAFLGFGVLAAMGRSTRWTALAFLYLCYWIFTTAATWLHNDGYTAADYATPSWVTNVNMVVWVFSIAHAFYENRLLIAKKLGGSPQ